jgi:hypothetical protein
MLSSISRALYRSTPTEQGHYLIPTEDIERALSKYCAPPSQQKGRAKQIPPENFQNITNLLRDFELHNGLQGWSRRPRTYTILRNINRTGDMQFFIDDHTDMSLPYTLATLPAKFSDEQARQQFLGFQDHVLTPARELEQGDNGRHVHFPGSADQHFHFVRKLGRGGFGYVNICFEH